MVKMSPEAAAKVEEKLKSFRQVKPAKITDLFILGMLASKDLSGYDIYKAIASKSDFIGSWLKLNKGTVYNTLARFNNQKFIEVVESKSSGNKPDKTIYGMTEHGREHLRTLLKNNFDVPPVALIPFILDFLSYHVLTKDEIREALEKKIEQTEILINLTGLVSKSGAGTVIEYFIDCEAEILKVMRDSFQKLLNTLDDRPVEDFYRIPFFSQEEVLARMNEIQERK